MLALKHARMICWSALTLIVGLAGCESTGSLDPRDAGKTSADKAIVIFTVSHDKNTENLFKHGANVKFFVYFSSVPGGNQMPRAFSNMETVAPVMTTPFQNVWGRVFVRQVDPGRYELARWEVIQDTGAGVRVASPSSKPEPVGFEAVAGKATYIGNIHAALIWAKNPFGIDILAGAAPALRNEASRDLPLVLAEYPTLAGRILVEPLPVGLWRSEAQLGKDTSTDLRWSAPPVTPPLK